MRPCNWGHCTILAAIGKSGMGEVWRSQIIQMMQMGGARPKNEQA